MITGDTATRLSPEKEFIRQIQLNQNIIHKICLAFCRSEADKEDIYQEIILQLWKSYHSFRGESAFSTWMYRVAMNTAVTMTRKQWSVLGTDRLPEIHEGDVSNPDFSEEIRLLYKAISHLKNVEKALILMWLDEKSYEEIAQTIGISVKNVSVKLVRVKAKLGEIIRKLQ